MSDAMRKLKNGLKLLLMVISGGVFAAVLIGILAWPLSLWWFLGESLSLAAALTIIWVAALQGI